MSIEVPPFDYKSAAETLYRVARHVQALHASGSCQQSDQQDQERLQYTTRSSHTLNAVIAYPDRFDIRSRALWRSRFGTRLEEKGYLTWMVICPIVLLFVSEVALNIFLGSANLSSSLSSMKVLPKLFAMFSCWALLHMMNKDVFMRVVKSFECIWIIGCSTSIDVFKIISMYRSTDTWGLLPQMLECLNLVIITIPLSTIFATVDCLQARGKAKLALVIFGCAYRAYIWFHIRFMDKSWDEAETCIAARCGPSLKALALAAASQVAVFMLKAFVMYARGQAFAFLRPMYKFEVACSEWQCDKDYGNEGTLDIAAAGLAMPVVASYDVAGNVHTDNHQGWSAVISL